MPDHYETLQLSPSADRETIERVYRLLAKRYHPDNPTSGDAHRFGDVLEAYRVLSDPEARASYDARYEDEREQEWGAFRRSTAADERDEDQRLFGALLSLLYAARRRNPRNAGMAPYHLERLLGTPQEHLEFPLWYLKKRGLVEVQPDGLLAITVDGVDQLGQGRFAVPSQHLLADASVVPEADDEGRDVRPDIEPPGGDVRRAAGE